MYYTLFKRERLFKGDKGWAEQTIKRCAEHALQSLGLADQSCSTLSKWEAESPYQNNLMKF